MLEAAGAEVVDLDGRVVLRGLWDEHVHVTQAALAAAAVPLGGAGSAEEALRSVRAEIDRAGPDEPVIGVGFQDGLWRDRPTQRAIDAIAGERTVVLVSHDVHAVWLSSAAARRFEVQPGPDGMLREGPAFGVGQQTNALAAARTDRAVRTLLSDAVRRGVVGVVDLEMTWNRDVWLERAADGWMGPRIEAGVYGFDLERAIALGMRTGQPLGDPGGLLSVGPMKTLVDGALNTRTAYCVDPYPDGGTGVLVVPPEELVPLVRRAGRAGFVPAVHAIGDAAVTAALDSFATAGVRGRIEHAQLIAHADVPRFAALGVTASVQPAHLLDDRAVAAQHWPDRTGRAYPFRSLLDAGATLAFGSDAPVAPLDPWRALRAAVDRALPGEAEWHPEQRIPLSAALDASTRGRAVPRPGDSADLIALDRPVAALDPDAVAMTLIAGRFAHRSL
ncbi:MAG: amidohydrolase family protein [Acidobacteria bacterium]|nr:amidohydrolase family protein [Acidobacteriota bacterium]